MGIFFQPLFFVVAMADQASAVGEDVSLESLISMEFEDLMDFVVVAPTKSGIRLGDTPGAVSVISHDQIQRSSARSIPELLRSIPGVNVRWNPMVQTIDVRGFGSNPFTSKILILIDGIPYNSWNKGGFPQHPGFDFFNLNNVRHIEIIRGPGSALYGENALNGVINIVTLSGEEASRTRLSAQIGDRQTRAATLTYGNTVGEHGSVYASVRGLRSQIPTELWVDENNAEAEATDFFIKAKYKDLTLSYYQLDDAFEGYSHPLSIPGLPPGEFRSAEKIEQTVRIVSAKYEYESKDQSWTFTANGSKSSRDGSHCAACHSASQDVEFETSDDHGYQEFMSSHLTKKLMGGHEFLAGIESRRIDTGGHAEELQDSPLLPSSHSGHAGQDVVTAYRKNAAYIQDQYVSRDKKWRLLAGIRYDQATRPLLFDGDIYPRVSAIYKPNEQLTLRGGWGKAVRYPSFSELYQASNFLNYDFDGGFITLAEFVPNQDLRPEFIEVFDFGFQYEFGNDLTLRLDLFRNRVSNSIVIAYPAIRSENHPNDAIITGGEVELRHKVNDRLSWTANWSYQHNKQEGDGADSAGNPIEFTYAPKHKVNFSGVWRSSEHIQTTLDIHWKDKYIAPSFWYPIVFDDPTVFALSGFTYVNVSTTWDLPFFDGDGQRDLSLNVSARNLLDERPYETLTGFGGRVVGREFYASLSLQFD